MIEFKAECGHTIRARDDDAGHPVRCTYCGRETAVPDSRGDGLGFLFEDVDSAARPDPSPRRGWLGRKRGLFTRRAPTRSEGYSIIVQMCYVAALIAVVFFVGKKYFLPLFEAGGVPDRVAGGSTGRAKRGSLPPVQSPGKPARTMGLLGKGRPSGIYVNSTPSGATAYCILASKLPQRGSICGLPGVVHAKANGSRIPVKADGTYVVEVAIAWTDSRLNDPNLPNHKNYWALRRALQAASDEERVDLVSRYFVPDEATRVFVDETEDQLFIVRRYKDIQVRGGRSRGVRALFLPRIELPGREAFSFAELVQRYIPQKENYDFDEDQARIELDFYDVPESDRPFVLKALKRIGLAPYVTPDGVRRMFKIGIDDGVFAMKILHEASE